MRRLYHQIYLTVLASLALAVLAMGALWRFSFETGPAGEALTMAGEVVAAALPSVQTPPAVQQAELARLAVRLKADLALFDQARAPIASAVVSGGAPILPPDAMRHGFWRRGWSLKLPDGRWLVVRLPPERRPPGYAWLAFLLVVAAAVALAAFPLVRRLTRRLERLQASVEALGSGDLSARVRVHGRDEVARLAASFNRAAARIEELVGSHRMLLANASHELRTPLARIRVGLELIGENADPARRAQLGRDIAELDGLIEEILIASRLDAVSGLAAREEVDLLALAAEEAARYDACTAEGEAAVVAGDPRLLRRMVRNLLENARRHGAPPVNVTVRWQGGAAVLQVRDHGRGVPAGERERIFEPFYRSDAASARLSVTPWSPCRPPRASPGVASPETGAPAPPLDAPRPSPLDTRPSTLDTRPVAADLNIGTGLGLSLVRTIARRHGGDALCRDVPEGEGALIEVRLPAEAPA